MSATCPCVRTSRLSFDIARRRACTSRFDWFVWRQIQPRKYVLYPHYLFGLLYDMRVCMAVLPRHIAVFSPSAAIGRWIHRIACPRYSVLVVCYHRPTPVSFFFLATCKARIDRCDSINIICTTGSDKFLCILYRSRCVPGTLLSALCKYGTRTAVDSICILPTFSAESRSAKTSRNQTCYAF